MKLFFTEKALRDYYNLNLKLQNLVDKQLDFLLHNIRYPSLKAKKYNKSSNLWQARVDKSYRFYFCIKKDTYTVITITKHP